LQNPGRLFGVGRILHLRDQDEKHEMPGVGKDRVRDGHKGVVKAGGPGHGDVPVGGRERACCRHAHDSGDQNTNAGGDAEPGQLVEGAWEGQKESGDGKYS
jgi:hypothetical protein